MQSTDQLFESGRRDITMAGGEQPPAVADLLSLLDSAERAGLRSGRAMRLRAKLERGLVPDAERTCAMEQWLRDWLAHREAAAVLGLHAPAVTA